ncbi:hypothetical protein FGO68_gene17204 [Halteria grandinella]|uniref:Fatty acid desaturase domain-containing protein n=1 Tax=Halteria grandinella TaxID=5974 RepID=A0A8J8NP05_HALGN|nr:hypothetical protein FGO68_gene17204 [Halteria grandinella]
MPSIASHPITPLSTPDTLPSPSALNAYVWRQILLTLLVQSVFPLGFTLSLYLGNPLLLVWCVFVLFPVLDLILPQDNWNPQSKQEAKLLENDKRFLIPLYAVFVSDLAIFWYALKMAESGNLRIYDFVMLAFMTAQSSAANAGVGHELYHRRNKFHKVIGTISYVKFYYSHMTVAHVKFHHKIVATPQDPTTSRMGESLYAYLLRGITGSFLEVYSLNKDGFSEGLRHLNYYVCLFVGIFLSIGLKAALFSLLSGFLCMIMIETVNYVEHYGLQRKLIDGVYELVNIRHSWNAPQVVTNFMLFKLQRHSDHHANAYKPYQILESLPESPQLPHGYSASLILAMIPSVWFAVADPLAKAANNNEKVDDKILKEVNNRAYSVLIPSFILMTVATFYLPYA